MSNLLQALTEDAVSLTESDLPAPDQVRTVLAALVKHVEQLEIKILPADVAAPVEQLQATVAADAEQAVAGPAQPAAPPAPAVAAPAAPAADDLEAESESEAKQLITRLLKVLGG